MKTARMIELEAEYDGPIAQVIEDLRTVAGGNTWRTVASILGVHRDTLRTWRRSLGLDVGYPGSGGHTDPLSYPHGVHSKSLDHQAIEEGFKSGTALVLHYRIDQRLSREETARRLGVHPETVTRYTPPAMRGFVERWRPRARRSDLLSDCPAERSSAVNVVQP